MSKVCRYVGSDTVVFRSPLWVAQAWIPLSAASLGRNEVQPKSVHTLKIPDFHSGYTVFLGSGIFAKVGPSANHLSRPFPDDGYASFFFFEGDLPRTPKQKLREQCRVQRERSVGDHWKVSGTATIFSRRDLR